MKKMLLALVLVMVLCVPAFATAVTSPDDVITQTNTQTVTGGNATGGSVGAITNSVGTGAGSFSPTALGGTATIQPGAIVNDPKITNNANPINTQNMNNNLSNNKLTNTNTNINDPSFKNTNTNTNLSNSTAISNSNSKATAINKQGQSQGQGQMNDWSQTYNNPMQLLGAIPIIPNPIPLIQGGRVGDVTAQVVKFGIPATAYNGERVKRVLKVVKGSIFGRTRLEDIEIDLIEGFKGVVDKYGSKNFDLVKVRYIVQYKDSTMGAGVGGGGAVSASGLPGAGSGIAGSLAVLPGYTRSTADPMYLIKFFEVE